MHWLVYSGDLLTLLELILARPRQTISDKEKSSRLCVALAIQVHEGSNNIGSNYHVYFAEIL